MSESIDRRQFLQTATLAATAATAVTGATLAAEAKSGAKSVLQHAGPLTRRWTAAGPLAGAPLAARQHHPLGRNGLGSAALGVSVRALRPAGRGRFRGG